MDDLRVRFDALEQVVAPDVWDDVQRRLALLEAGAGERLVGVAPATTRWTARARPKSRSADRRVVWWLIAATFLVLALVAGLLATGRDRSFTQIEPTHVAPTPSEPSPSPSSRSHPVNGLIAYSSNGQIFVASPGGTDPHLLAAAGKNAFRPTWSPDGERIAFLSLSCPAGQPCDRKDSPTSLVVMNADGSGRVTLEHDLRWVQTFDWSPDGSRLAFDADRPQGESIVAADGSGLQTIGDGQYGSWSPDGKFLAYSGDGGTHVVAADGSGDHRLLERSDAGEAVGGLWSPDGSQLAFVWRQACCPPANRASDAWIVEPSGRSPHRMSEVPAGAYFEGWSPDGRTIAWLEASEPGAAVKRRLVLADSGGANPRAIATATVGIVAWSPDSTRLLISVVEGSETRLVVIDPDGVAPEVELPADDASWQSLP